MSKEFLTVVESNGVTFCRGVFSRASDGVLTKEALAAMLEQAKPVIANRCMFGGIGQDEDITIERVTHLVTKLELQDDVVVGEVELVNTPKGLDLKRFLAVPGSKVTAAIRAFYNPAFYNPAYGVLDGNCIKLTSYDLIPYRQASNLFRTKL